MKEPIIVTAFWDVGRSENCEFPRSNERYYAEFAEWARIKNNLIVYTDKYSESRIREIRKKYGLEDKTIVIVHDIFKEEEELLKKCMMLNIIAHLRNLDIDQRQWKIEQILIMRGS